MKDNLKTLEELSPQRAREIIATAQSLASGKFCQWTDNLDKCMTTDERNQVLDVWSTMPGHTSFLDALTRIARRVGA